MIYKIFYDKMGGDGNGNEFVELPTNPFPDIPSSLTIRCTRKMTSRLAEILW